MYTIIQIWNYCSKYQSLLENKFLTKSDIQIKQTTMSVNISTFKSRWYSQIDSFKSFKDNKIVLANYFGIRRKKISISMLYWEYCTTVEKLKLTQGLQDLFSKKMEISKANKNIKLNKRHGLFTKFIHF